MNAHMNAHMIDQFFVDGAQAVLCPSPEVPSGQARLGAPTSWSTSERPAAAPSDPDEIHAAP